MKAIASETGLTLPASAVVEKYYEPQSMFNRLWVAKVRIPEASFAELKETILKKKSFDGVDEDKNGLPESVTWWKPVGIDFKRWYDPGDKDGDLAVEVVASQEGAERVLYIYGVP